METTHRDRSALDQSAHPVMFSLLTCLFAGGCILAVETIIDIYFYYTMNFPAQLPVGKTVARLTVGAVKAVYLHPVYSFGLFWWPPVVITSLILVRKLGRPAMVYGICGVLLYLLLIHNFRGIAVRHNVFEAADDTRRLHTPGVPHPLGWDLSFLLAALLGSGLAWVGSRNRLREGEASPAMHRVSDSALFWSGVACVAVGIAESVITNVSAAPLDRYRYYPTMTHGYATLAYGVLTVILAKFRTILFDFDIS